MPSDINNVNLGGRIGSMELRELGEGGDNYLRIRLASNRRKKEGEDWVDVANWFTVTVFGDARAKALEQMLEKGQQIHLTGELRYREWEDGEGNKREGIEVVVGGPKGELSPGRKAGEGNGGSQRANSAPDPDEAF